MTDERSRRLYEHLNTKHHITMLIKATNDCNLLCVKPIVRFSSYSHRHEPKEMKNEKKDQILFLTNRVIERCREHETKHAFKQY